MKIIQLIPSIGKESSGPAYCLPPFCRHLAKNGSDVELHTLIPIPVSCNGLNATGYPLHKFPSPKLGRSPEMRKALPGVCRDADIVHTHSLWMLPNVYPLAALQGSKAKLVLSPHGTMMVFTTGKFSLQKKLFWYWKQKAVLEQTAMFHATCEKEYQEIRAGGFMQPVAIVPFGIDFIKVERSRPARRKLLFLGRIHPIKAVDRLLLAWNKVCRDFPDWDFQIVGPDCGLEGKLRKLIAQFSIPRVEFPGEQNGAKKYDYYAGADLYVLPSFTENFGVTVAEALACGAPVIAGTQTPWNGLTTNGCGWWVDNSPETLAEQLRESLAMSRSALEEMGKRGQVWMQRDFSWDGCARKMDVAYRWLLNSGEPPEFVQTTRN